MFDCVHYRTVLLRLCIDTERLQTFLKGTAMKTDKQLQKDVLAELEWEPSVHATHIGVEVDQGIVTLSGHVDSYSEKWGAERAVKRVSGTRAVVIELDVKIKNSAKRSDADIALSAVDRMQWQANIPNDAIHVSVEKGVITLTGDVAWRYQRDAAYEAVRNLTGAVGVINQILIKPKVNTVAIKGDIEAALKRHASLEAQKISVLLDGDKVTLTGKVPTWSEKHLAFNAAWNSPGVRSVLDKLVVG